jgi:hypothetical protein
MPRQPRTEPRSESRALAGGFLAAQRAAAPGRAPLAQGGPPQRGLAVHGNKSRLPQRAQHAFEARVREVRGASGSRGFFWGVSHLSWSVATAHDKRDHEYLIRAARET